MIQDAVAAADSKPHSMLGAIASTRDPSNGRIENHAIYIRAQDHHLEIVDFETSCAHSLYLLHLDRLWRLVESGLAAWARGLNRFRFEGNFRLNHTSLTQVVDGHPCFGAV